MGTTLWVTSHAKKGLTSGQEDTCQVWRLYVQFSKLWQFYWNMSFFQGQITPKDLPKELQLMNCLKSFITRKTNAKFEGCISAIVCKLFTMLGSLTQTYRHGKNYMPPPPGRRSWVHTNAFNIFANLQIYYFHLWQTS